MRKKICLFLILCIFPCFAFAQDGASDFERRLRALEQHLGLSTDQASPSGQAALLERLEALEKAVYGDSGQPAQAIPSSQTEDGAVDPPPDTGSELQWQKWDSDEDAPSPVLGDVDLPEASDYLSAYGKKLDFGGYAWVSYYYDDKRDSSTFNANSIEFNLTAELSDWAIMGADIDVFNEGLDPVLMPFRHPNFGGGDSGPYGGASTGGDDDDDLILEQLFLRMRANDSLEFTAGKFNVPVGLEKRDGGDRYTIFHSLIFDLWPRDLTGVMATYKATEDLSFSPYVFNGWDADENVNDSLLYALYSNYQILDSLNLAGTVAYGPPFPNNNSDDATLLDLELRYTGIDRLWTGLELMYVTSDADHVPGFKTQGEASYFGALAIAHYDFLKYFGLTLQGSYVDDVDGFLWGTPQDRWEFSLVPTVYLAEGLEIRFHYQHLESSERLLFEQKDPTNRWSKSDDVFGLAAFWWF